MSVTIIGSQFTYIGTDAGEESSIITGITVPAGATKMIVTMGYDYSNTVTSGVSNVQLGSTNAVFSIHGVDFNFHTEIWILDTPTIGAAQTVTITSVGAFRMCACVSFTAGAASGIAASTFGGASTANTTITIPNNGLGISSWGSSDDFGGAQTLVSANSQTDLCVMLNGNLGNFNSACHKAAYLAGTGISQTLGYTATTSPSNFGVTAIALSPAATNFPPGNMTVNGTTLTYADSTGFVHTVLGGISNIATTYTPGQMIVANTNLIYCDANGTTRIIPGANQGASSYTPGCVRIVGNCIRWTGTDGNEYAAYGN